jgi:hypothetical protein
MYTLHITYDLRDAFRQPHCPLCMIGAAGERRYLDYVLYARVTEPEFRTELRASRGFCTAHAQLLTEYRGALGVAILCGDLVANLLDALQGAYNELAASGQRQKAHAEWARNLAAQIEPNGLCPACACVQRSDAICLTGLFNRLADPPFAPGFTAGDGLCLPHLVQALRYPAPSIAIEIMI